MTTVFFGERWDSPRLQFAIRVPTPMAGSCLMCEEAIVEGDRGFLVGMWAGDESVICYVHAECEMADIIGHSVGVCSCTGFEPGRDRARAVWRRVAELKTAGERGHG
jgi:hypothetical protein